MAQNRLRAPWTHGLLLIAFTLISGCTMKGGGLMPSAAGTASPMTWESTAASPKTIVIVDTRTGENIFEVDIPIGKQLSVHFKPVSNPIKGTYQTDTMIYAVHPIGEYVGNLDRWIQVPLARNRRIDVFLQNPEAYTPPDPDRPVQALDVPMPPSNKNTSSKPVQSESSPPKAAPDAKPAEAPGMSEDSKIKLPAVPMPSSTPATPEANDDAASGQSAAAKDRSSESLPARTVSPEPRSSMTWTDTGGTRRVSIRDMVSDTTTFEVDVPQGHDLVMVFYEMWLPPGTPPTVEAMKWQIVPAGDVVSVPQHHATVPIGSRRQIREQPIDLDATPTLATPSASSPPVDLLNDHTDTP